MHPALRSWREQLPSSIVRLLAYLGAVATLSMASAHFSQSPEVMDAITSMHQTGWVDIARPFAAFALSIPEAADVPASYAIRRHVEGNGRKDILTLGEPDSMAPLLRVEIYRPGNEVGRFADPRAEMLSSADALGPTWRCSIVTNSSLANSGRSTSCPFLLQKVRRAAASASFGPTAIRACNYRAGSVRAAPRSLSKALWHVHLTA